MNDTSVSPVPLPMMEGRTRSVATIPQSRQRRPIILVLGMHRSGTSLCAHVLSALGAEMADEIAAHETNAKGHWERRRIVDLHDRVLNHFNRGFYELHHDFSLPVAWWADPEVGEARRNIIDYLSERMGDAPFGIKDPRTARLLPMWHQIFNELRLAPKFIICLRKPAQVARSLHVRDGFDLDVGEFRWFSYVIDCFRYTKNYEICVLEYESWFEDPAVNLGKLRDFIGPSRFESEIDIEFAVSEIVDSELRHDDANRAPARQPLIRSLYALARRASDDAAARRQIQDIAAQYSTFDQLHRGFQREFERSAALAHRVPGLEQNVAAVSAALDETQSELTSAKERAAQSSAREGAAVAEIGRINQKRSAELILAETAQAEISRQRDEIARLRELAKAGERAAEQARRIDKLSETLAAAETLLSKQASESDELRDAVAENGRRLQLRERIAAELRSALTQQSRLVERGLLGGLTRRLRRRQVRAAIRAGDKAIRAGDWVGAVVNYREALDRAPALSAIWVQLGHALKEQQNYAAAEIAYLRSLALDESVADTHLQLGHLLKLQDRLDEAGDAYAQALCLDPASGHASSEVDRLCERFIAAGDQARDARNWSGAALEFRRALARKPSLTPIWVQLGHALKEQRLYAEAEAAYRRALTLDSNVADTHLQLGHLLKLQGRHAPATEAYATAVRLDPGLDAARDSLNALLGYSPSEAERAILANGSDHKTAASNGSGNGHGGLWVPGDPEAARSERSDGAIIAGEDAILGPAERYGALFAEASLRSGGGSDVVWLGVIDWHFRIQRPQHLATNLADAGSRVFYISLVFEPADAKGRFRIIESPHPGVFEIRLRLQTGAAESIYRGLSRGAVGELQTALDEVIAAMGLCTPVVLVEHPAWYEVAYGVPGATVVYDCLDLATGFSNTAKSLPLCEKAMLTSSDLVIAASQPLAEHIEEHRSSILIRNAADVAFFAGGFTDRLAGDHPVIGYFGAIAEWFNIEWIEHCAAARPDWEFRLIGRTAGCDTSRATKLPNVKFFGEKPYQELPSLLREFDVAVIPFKLIDLIRCTNPVKLYEYMAAGKAVVAARMPEVVEATDLVYIADDADSFVDTIERALAEDSLALRTRRQAWAEAHTWATRGRDLGAAIEASFPLVSVVVLTYNNWDYTAACLASLRSYSDYPNLEIIVVDNASTDGTRDKLRVFDGRDDKFRVILNETNLGFAGGNNVGLRAARGEYVILLNNDTYVTRGWVRDLIRPMQLDRRIGMVGPLTNNIGNEQKIKLSYRAMPEMQDAARRFVRGRLRHTYDANNLAFFCVAIRRSVVDEVGLLDEAYGVGYYEDDDYCRRVRQAGHKLVIADDVFVHHRLGASFEALGSGEASALMARNREIFERRWGPWQPHRYRDEPGFG